MAEIPQVIVTINARGELVGDTSLLPAELVEQLSTPEAKARMKQQYKDKHGSGRRESRIAPRYIVDASFERLDYRKLTPAGLSKSERNKLRKKVLRTMTERARRKHKIAQKQEEIVNG